MRGFIRALPRGGALLGADLGLAALPAVDRAANLGAVEGVECHQERQLGVMGTDCVTR